MAKAAIDVKTTFFIEASYSGSLVDICFCRIRARHSRLDQPAVLEGFNHVGTHALGSNVKPVGFTLPPRGTEKMSGVRDE
jgi:hypothetical protein